jgi:signal transduction histidine kinase
VARHARARHASVSLVRRNSRALLTIEDDGVGFDIGSDTGGSGLNNMRARAAGLGGEMRLTSRFGKGSKLQVTFPL